MPTVAVVAVGLLLCLTGVVEKEQIYDRPPNPHLRDIQEDKISLKVNNKYGVHTAVHRFVFRNKVKGIRKSATTRERIAKIELEQTMFFLLYLPTFQTSRKDSDASMWKESGNEEMEWEDDDINKNC